MNDIDLARENNKRQLAETALSILRDRHNRQYIADAFRTEHRTNQQSILSVIFLLIGMASEQYNTGRTDARNDAGCMKASDICKAVPWLDLELPYI